MHIGTGIISWDGAERRSDRYGVIALVDATYDDTVSCEVLIDLNNLANLKGRRVRLKARVLESRKSGHLGDMTHKIYPTQPDVGEEVDLGVGVLQTRPAEFAAVQIALEPGDGREKFWIDPHKLYRLHDQTVALSADETDEDFSPPPDIRPGAHEAVATGESDNSVQVKGPMPKSLLPDVQRLGHGMFMFSPPEMVAGKRLKTRY